MKRRALVQAAAVIRKELREASRMGRRYALIVIALSTFIQWMVINNYLAKAEQMAAAGEQMGPMGAADLIELAPTFSLIFVAPIVIPFLANALLSPSLIQERLMGSLMPLLATGVDAGLVWASKVVGAFLFAYGVMLSCLALDLALIYFYFELTVAWSTALVVTVLIIAPWASLAILAIMSFLFWTVRPAHVVASTLPVLTTMGLFAYVSTHPVTEVLLRGVATVSIAALLIIGVCAFGIGRLSRQFIVGI